MSPGIQACLSSSSSPSYHMSCIYEAEGSPKCDGEKHARDFSWSASLVLLNNDRQVHPLMDLTIDVVGPCYVKWSNLNATAINLHVVDLGCARFVRRFGD